MKFRPRTLIISVLTLLGLVSIIYIASHLILMRSFADLEERDVRANILRVVKALNIQLEAISTIAIGYSMWDDTYRFISERNQDYIDLNMMDTTFVDYQINTILYLNNDLQTVFEKAVDLASGTETRFPQSLYPHLRQGSPVVDLPEIESHVNGIVGLPQGALMFSAQPVITSEGFGPINGVQIWGRFLDRQFFEQLSTTTDFAVTARRFDALALPVDFELARDNLRKSGGVFVHAMDAETVAGYTIVEDIYGEPMLVLRITLPRVIYAQGEASVGYFLTAMVLSSIVVALFAQSRFALEELNVDLEKRVQQRTSELSETNVLLRQEIAERKQIEADLEQTRDKALEALQLKTQILANVSHDARTPLTTIMLRTELLQRGRYGPLPPEQRQILDLILTNARQLLTFVNNLLTEAQFNGQNIPLAHVMFSPSVLLEEVFHMVAPMAERKQLTLTKSVGSGLPETLYGDPLRLQQILTNLLENAIRFTERGTISVMVERPDETHWSMRVSDTGRGIPKDAQSRIFEAFWQIDGSMTREVSRGVGLGLSIVRQLTTMLGGEIALESIPGQGSTFTITFPLNGKQGAADDGASPRFSHRG
jgi:signal transduction histidine kinase